MTKPGDVTRKVLHGFGVLALIIALTIVLTIVMGVIVATPAQAISVEAYQKWRLSRQTVRATPTGIMEIRLHGVLQGLLIANVALAKQASPRLFCVPKGTSLKATELRKAIDAELKSPSNPRGRPYLKTRSIGSVVLVVVRQKWPCTKSDEGRKSDESKKLGQGEKKKAGGEEKR